jgi:hypothetical protein
MNTHMKLGFVVDVAVLLQGVVQPATMRHLRDRLCIKAVFLSEYVPGLHNSRGRVDERPNVPFLVR